MFVTSNLPHSAAPFPSFDPIFAASSRSIVALDVEWTKNYRIKGGSRPFCYSIVLLRWPHEGASLAEYPSNFHFKSVYVERPEGESRLISSLEQDLETWLESDSLLTGHQLSSDLSVIKNAATKQSFPNISHTYSEWRNRRQPQGRVFDTRYDIDHLPVGRSRRLVDVCNDLYLNVEQPELGRHSMTKLHKSLIERPDRLVREKILTLNLRHSLSTALVACLGLGLASIARRNVNKLLHQELRDSVAYVNSEDFHRLL